MLVNCTFLDKCRSAGLKCNHCKNNASIKKDYYEPYTPYIPYSPWWEPWYTGGGNVVWYHTQTVGDTNEADDYFEQEE